MCSDFGWSRTRDPAANESDKRNRHDQNAHCWIASRRDLITIKIGIGFRWPGLWAGRLAGLSTSWAIASSVHTIETIPTEEHYHNSRALNVSLSQAHTQFIIINLWAHVCRFTRPYIISPMVTCCSCALALVVRSKQNLAARQQDARTRVRALAKQLNNLRTESDYMDFRMIASHANLDWTSPPPEQIILHIDALSNPRTSRCTCVFYDSRVECMCSTGTSDKCTF